MKYYSTNHKSPKLDIASAVLQGLAPDGGLYMPESIPTFSRHFLDNMDKMTFREIAYETGRHYFRPDIPEFAFSRMIEESYDFEVPIIKVKEDTFAFELFHGPTLAFKDFAARFMARLISYLANRRGKKVSILVATSGDTGSAVGHGFLGVKGIDVHILYPSGKVSEIQEKQLTTMGQNISTLEVKGTFDDCQALVKRAFLDEDIRARRNLASANSINIARLIPQAFYYVYLSAQMKKYGKPLVVSIPSGNFGNLTAGLIAKKMGAPIDRFIASTNINDTVPRYLTNETYDPRPSVATISNAMDVGDPSNFARMNAIFDGKVNAFKKELDGYSFTDQETRNVIGKVYEEYDYIMDPHGAVGWLGLEAYRSSNKHCSGVFVETAHPAKFGDVVSEVIGKKVNMPDRLAVCMNKSKKSLIINNDYDEFKTYLSKL